MVFAAPPPTESHAKIKCQNRHGDKRECPICGVLRYVLYRERRCIKCDVEAWFRPGSAFRRSGTAYYSFDGCKFIYYRDGSLCVQCDEKKKSR